MYLNIADNIDNLASTYDTDKIITVPNFLSTDTAERVYNHLVNKTDWQISIHPYQPTIYTFDQTEDNKDFIQAGIESANASRVLGHFSYVFYRGEPHINCNCNPLCEIGTFMRSQTVLDRVNQITKEQVTGATTVFGSCFQKECFLNVHDDRQRGKIAFVLNLTPHWHKTDGGELQFLNWDYATVKHTVPPTFNSLSMFNVEGNGIPHRVTYVPPDTVNKRFAITGWFY
jgi:Rps23 Pro-64 3,4-dihydroxylase Tpa1-like proline 4-hydroxylase